MVKNLSAKAGEARVVGLIPGSERSPGEGKKETGTHSSILAWRIPWTEEPGGLHTVHGVAKSRTRLSDFTFFLSVSIKIYLLPLNEECQSYKKRGWSDPQFRLTYNLNVHGGRVLSVKLYNWYTQFLA